MIVPCILYLLLQVWLAHLKSFLDSSFREGVSEFCLMIVSCILLLQVWLPELKSFPEELGEMENVEQMVISGKELKSLPASLGNLHKLRFLILEDLPELKELPATFSQLRALTELRIKECPSLKVDLLSLFSMRLSSKSRDCLRGLLRSGNAIL